MAKKNHFVNNAELYQHFIKWRADIKKAEAEGRERPVMPRYIANVVVMMVERYGTIHKYARQTRIIDEMKGNAIERLVRYGHTFDTDNYKNPFGWITMIIERAFIQTALKEKKHDVIAAESLKRFVLENQQEINANSGEYELLRQQDAIKLSDRMFDEYTAEMKQVGVIKQ